MDLDEYSSRFSESEMIIVKYYKIMKMFCLSPSLRDKGKSC